jgi:hypothetical protein
MKKFALTIAAGLFATFAAGSASAALINFAAEGSNGGERAIADGAVLNTAKLGGLNLRFDAGVLGNGDDVPYFNGKANNQSAGLGVCTSPNRSNTCSPGVDYSIAPNEWVRVAFLDGPFKIRSMSFGIEPGNGDTSGLVAITTSLKSMISTLTLTFAEASVFNFGFVDWVQFDFANTEFVVASISDIPVPGALPLLLSGLAGLGFAASRRRKG